MNDKKKLKRKLALSFVMLLLLAVMLAFSGITLAWFYKGNDQIPADTLSGSIHAAYFNGGNGTAPSANATYKTEASNYPSYEYGGTDGPYQIDNATQLYNFAWLQYLGYFDDTTYFVLTDNINASGIVLPPVGTSDNPFVGYFDGNGYTISGLRVSNDKTKLNNTNVDGNKFNIPHQALENEELTDSAEIVGFFGVVGEIDKDYKLAPFVPTVKNLTLSGATIETKTSNSLAGIAAGYVNGVMEGVVVSGTSTITNAEKNVTPLSYTDNLSDYALVGFCEEPYRKSLKVETVNVYEPSVELGSLGRLGESGSGNAWGNSIDIKKIYDEMVSAYDDGDSFFSYPVSQTIRSVNGVTTVIINETTQIPATISQNGEVYHFKTTHTEAASYAIYQQDGTNTGQSGASNAFNYLYGDKMIGTINTATTYEDDTNAVYIKDKTNNFYLTLSLSGVESENLAAKWAFEASDNGYKIYTKDNTGTKRYLCKNGTNLIIGNDEATATEWTKNENNGTVQIYNDGYYLTCNEAWGGSIDFKAFNNRIYHLLNAANGVSSSSVSSPSQQPNQDINTITYNKTILSYNRYHRYYADNYNIISHAELNQGNADFNKDPNSVALTYRFEGEGTFYNYTNDKTNQKKIKVPGTVLPILVNDNDDYKTLMNNTGYIISGDTGDAASGYGVRTTVRSASVAISMIGQSYSPSNPNNLIIYTNSQAAYNQSSFVNIETSSGLNLVKYAKSKEKLLSTLSSSGLIHGLHFAGKNVSYSDTTIISKAYINGNEYNNYVLPKNCIDFNFKENGYVNFFAGSYSANSSTNADSFFALYRIERNGETISSNSIHEIKKIYTNSDSSTNLEYPYYFVYDSGHSTGNQGTLLFDMQYLTSQPPTQKALYYFEIPLNKGEYAMGQSGSKTNGAYLLYLDIGANDSEGDGAKFNIKNATDTVSTSDAGSLSFTVTGSTDIYTPPTYFPLKCDNGDVAADNTGYIISGAKYQDLDDYPGDIRVSRYNKIHNPDDYTTYKYYRSIYKSLTNGILADNKIYTYKFGNKGGWQTISQYGTDNFYKYLRAKEQLQKTMGSATTGDIYGLHFMNASVGMNNILTVPNAKINGTTYIDYQMPRDSIDFTLKTAGYINVFAGTYFSGSSVNCFFSLYKIERSGSEITAINEVSKIYKAGSTYYYQFTDGSFSDSLPADYELLFDTACLKVRNDLESDSVYYFEIPVSTGEFAIGSVNGGNGGYLLYLDISTHQGDSVVKREKMVINTVEYELPKGVIFDGADRTVFEVPITMTGDIVFTVNNGIVSATSPLTASFASSSKTIEKVTVSDQVGKFSIRRTTEGGNVTYEYSLRPLTPADSIEELAAYFNSSVNSAVYTYNYLLEGNNSVNNTSGDIEYSTDVGIAITRYEITARAIVEAVTAMVQAIDPGASYIEFNGVTNIQTSQTITIPT